MARSLPVLAPPARRMRRFRRRPASGGRGAGALLASATVAAAALAGGEPVMPESTFVLPLPGVALELELDPATGLVWASVADEGALYAISVRSRQIAARVRVGSRPGELDLSVDGTRIFVGQREGYRLAELDLASRAVRWFPVSSAVSPDGDGAAPAAMGQAVDGTVVIGGSPDFSNDLTFVQIPVDAAGAEDDPGLQVVALDGWIPGPETRIETNQARGRGFAICNDPDRLVQFDGMLPGSPRTFDVPTSYFPIRTMGFSPDGGEVVTGDGRIRLWDSFAAIASLDQDANWRFTDDGAYLVGAYDGTGFVVERATLDPVQTIPLPPFFQYASGDMEVLPGRGGFAVLRGDALVGATVPSACTGPPPDASHPIPADGAAVRPRAALELAWQNVGSDCPTTYEVRAGLADPPTQVIASGLDVPWTQAPAVEADETLYWQVVAVNAAGATEGPVWSYTGRPCPVPPLEATPVLSPGQPSDVEGDPWRQRIHVTVPDFGRIDVYDMQTTWLVDSWSVGSRPRGLDLSPDGSILWCVDNADGRVRGLDPIDGSVVATFDVADLLESPDGWDVLEVPGERLFVTTSPFGSGGGRLVTIDLTGAEPPRVIPTPGAVRFAPELELHPDGRRLFVTQSSPDLFIVDLEDPDLGLLAAEEPGLGYATFAPGGRFLMAAGGVLHGLEEPLRPLPRGRVSGITESATYAGAFGDESAVYHVMARDRRFAVVDTGTNRPLDVRELPAFVDLVDPSPRRLVPLPGRPGEGSRGFVAIFNQERMYFLLRPRWNDCDGDARPDGCAIAAGLVADANGDGVPDACGPPGDFDGDGCIGFGDLVTLLAYWSDDCADLGGGSACAADFDGDGDVDADDLLVLLAGYTGCG